MEHRASLQLQNHTWRTLNNMILIFSESFEGNNEDKEYLRAVKVRSKGSQHENGNIFHLLCRMLQEQRL